MAMHRSIAMVALVALAACAPGTRPGGPDDPPLIGLDRGECYGACPAYWLVIYKSGVVEYIGRSSVKKQGVARTMLSPNTMRELVARFDAAGFAALPEDLVGTTTDVPQMTLSFRDHEVHYSDGARVRGTAAAATVLELADAVERAVRIERWVGTPDERAAFDR